MLFAYVVVFLFLLFLRLGICVEVDVDRITILTMYLKKLQALQFWCFQHKVQIGIRKQFYQDFRAKLVGDPIFVSFHFSLYFYLIMQCRTPGLDFFFGGGEGGGNHKCRRLELLAPPEDFEIKGL